MGHGNEFGVTLSIFERLTDRHPGVRTEPAQSQWVSVAELEVSVMTHLSDLLNVRRADHPSDLVFPETFSSVAGYGILDLSALSLANPSDRDRIRRSLERAIRLFEPRLSRVSVRVKEPEIQDPTLQFRIDAVLRVDPIEEPVAFDALLAKDTRRFEVVGARE